MPHWIIEKFLKLISNRQIENTKEYREYSEESEKSEKSEKAEISYVR